MIQLYPNERQAMMENAVGSYLGYSYFQFES